MTFFVVSSKNYLLHFILSQFCSFPSAIYSNNFLDPAAQVVRSAVVQSYARKMQPEPSGSLLDTRQFI